MLIQEIKENLKKYKDYPHDFSIGRHLMILVCNFLIENHEEFDTRRYERLMRDIEPILVPSLIEIPKEPNPYDLVDKNEPFIATIEFRSLNGNIISPSYIGQLFHEDPNFFNFCGKKVGQGKGRFLIQNQRALHYLWEHAPIKIKRRLRKRLEENKLKGLGNAL